MYRTLNIKEILAFPYNSNGSIKYDERGTFVIVKASDDRKYQVKLNTPLHWGNLYELIGNYIGKVVGAPVIDGNFIDMNPVLRQLADFLSKNCNGLPIDIDFYKRGIFFGVEWKETFASAGSVDELMEFIGVSKNYRDIFGVFSYDQYLKNVDRHPGNFLIHKADGQKPKTFWLIDSDRIFHALKGKQIEHIKDDFECLDNRIYGYLYNLIDDSSFTEVLRYAYKIESISDKEIDKLVQYVADLYAVSQEEIDIIERVLRYRRLDFYTRCLRNQRCFPGTREKRLVDVV